MSNALLFARLLTEQDASRPVEATETGGYSVEYQQNSKTALRASQVAINQNNPLKLEYNKLLAREIKAEDYLSNPNRTPEDLDKWLPEFNQICMDLSSILNQLGEYTHEEAVSGFTVKQ